MTAHDGYDNEEVKEVDEDAGKVFILMHETSFGPVFSSRQKAYEYYSKAEECTVEEAKETLNEDDYPCSRKLPSMTLSSTGTVDPLSSPWRTMMSVSLYAHGTATIEVGKYGMTLQEAKEAFLATATKHGLDPKKVKESPTEIMVEFGWNDDGIQDLLHDVADVDDLHGDPPAVYTLKAEDVPEGEYVRTGSYND